MQELLRNGFKVTAGTSMYTAQYDKNEQTESCIMKADYSLVERGVACGYGANYAVFVLSRRVRH